MIPLHMRNDPLVGHRSRPRCPVDVLSSIAHFRIPISIHKNMSQAPSCPRVVVKWENHTLLWEDMLGEKKHLLVSFRRLPGLDEWRC